MAGTRTMLISARIRAARKERGWTAKDLIARLPANGPKLTESMISRIENGKRDLTVDELEAIGLAFVIVPEYLMRDGDLCPSCGQEMQP
jgi:transcriptional regulator with XRE-family HTH domain